MTRTSTITPALKNALVESALGQQVAIVHDGRNAARESLNGLLDLAQDLNVVKVSRKYGDLRIRFENGGQLRFLGSIDETHGVLADYVYAQEQYFTEDLNPLSPMVATTGGQILYFH